MTVVSHAPDTGLWLLNTPHTSYALRIDESGAPCHVAWGPRLDPDQAAELAAPPPPPHSSFEGRPGVGEELPVDGGARFGPPSLQVRFADGTRGFEWQPEGHRLTEPAPGVHELELSFRDRVHPLGVALRYRVHEDSDVIERRTGPAQRRGRRGGGAARRFGDLVLPPRARTTGYSHVTGQWGGGDPAARDALARGETVLTSRRGTTGHHANPWVIVDAGDASEDARRGVERRTGLERQLAAHRHAARPTTGARDRRRRPRRRRPGSWRRASGARRRCSPGSTPTAASGRPAAPWHDYARGHVLPHPEEPRPVLYNSWEATGFDVDEDEPAAARRAGGRRWAWSCS